MKKVKSVQGDTIDLICWRYYGRTAGVTETVLEYNPDLAEQGPITLQDNRGMVADSVDLTLDDSDHALEIPSVGAEMKVWLGWSDKPQVLTVGDQSQPLILVRTYKSKKTAQVAMKREWARIQKAKGTV
ncbi:tail protein X [Acinetobacter tandoii]|uniref:tail protein X n=1 Tax=Acinetobacter tandoii TaxID=202954 RepID=UPI0040458FC1